ncbi:sugar kinase [Verrucomicrobiaceae bacterium SCGC AG-212-N21]|nr:sugar kinase [Verrucomicrobiaceae bacterium SCGC AG-212-N21]
MNRLTETKIILVVRATRLADLKARFATKEQARFYVSSLGGDFREYEEEDANYQRAIAEAQQTLSMLGRVQAVQRTFLPNFVFGKEDVVVALGQDGLVANTLKYLSGQPLVGVNPDPKRWDGQLLPFQVSQLDKVMREVLRGGRRTRSVTMAEAALNTGLSLCAVNDLFIGMRSHGSARYRIAQGRFTEHHSSSGVVVSTGLGSTGWFKSLMTGAASVAAAAGHVPKAMLDWPKKMQFTWESEHLFYTVREPFPTSTTGTSLVFGKVTKGDPLVIESQMGEDGVIFSDGIEQDFVEFNSGTRATITLAQRKGRVVV